LSQRQLRGYLRVENSVYPAEAPLEARLPVTIITGFLGSGKTTLLNHILAGHHSLKTAVMVNEIGDISIDSELIVSATADMLELSNGCICCSVNNDLTDAMFRVLERDPPIDYLIVETTGLADPLPIILTFLRSEFRDRVRIDSIITIADADNFSLDRFDSQAADNQLRYADVILLNKCDLSSSKQLALVEVKIRDVKADARIIRTTHCDVPLALIIGLDLFQWDRFPRHQQEGPHRHQHLTVDGFGSFSFMSDRPFGVRKFAEFLNNELSDDVFRGKGILWMDERDKRYIFHLVGKRFSLDEGRWAGPKSNRLVLIGRNLDAAALRSRLEACLSPRSIPGV